LTTNSSCWCFPLGDKQAESEEKNMILNQQGKTSRKWLATASAIGLLGSLGACNVDQTSEGEMPDVDVSATAGQIPKYEVKKTQEGQLPDVDIDVKTGKLPEFEIETADIEVETKTVEVPYPDIDIEMPKDDE